MEDNPAYKVTVLGGEGVGKTALIIQFLSRTFVESVRNLALFLTLAYIFLA
jgi:GTPase SAR1 family protein